MFDTLEECHQKLAGCIVLRAGVPFYINNAVSASRVAGLVIGSGDAITEADLTELNYRALGNKLGYMNVPTYMGQPYNEATYLMKQAIRRSTQGLHEVNVYVSGFKGNGVNLQPTGQLRFGPKLYKDNLKEFCRMIEGKYPTMAKVKSDMARDNSIMSRAFHRWWAVERDPVGPYYLVYKTQRVGYTEDFDRIVMQDRFRFLRPDLEEMKCAA